MKALILIIFVSALIMSFLIWLLIQSLKSQPNRFDQLDIYDTFNISDSLENADFIKVSESKAMCLDSLGASYEKSMECAILNDQEITKTC